MNDSVQFLVFRLDGRQYALRLSRVERVLRSVDYSPLPQAPEIVLGVINLHGEIVPLFNIHRRFGLPDREVGVNDQMIITLTAARKVALVVESVIGMIECPAQEIVAAEMVIPHLRQVEGVIQMEDGLVIIHDLDRFLSLDEEEKLGQALVERPRHGC